MKVLTLFRNVFQLHRKPDARRRDQFEKCRSCEYGVLVRPWRIHRIAGCSTVVKARKDKTRVCNYKPKRFGVQGKEIDR